ncbi:MAG: hypothetical protein M3Z05_21065 [Gemmatimonadota bacterium]|nr:hypothetical protein [Gemmatimonadota bacterium]
MTLRKALGAPDAGRITDRAAAALPGLWRAEADRLERFASPASTAFREAALQLEAALRAEQDELLTLAAAALASGHSVDHLRHLVASGAIPQAGRKGAPRIRRADLPRKPGKGAASTYDVNADARRLTLGARQ